MSKIGYLENAVRDISDDEIAFYEEHGWVKLDGLVSKDAIPELLKAARALDAEARDALKSEEAENIGSSKMQGYKLQTPDWRGTCFGGGGELSTLVIDRIRSEPFFSLTFDNQLGRVAARLINRYSLTNELVGVRYLQGTVFCRTPGKNDVDHGTSYHQDFPDLDLDRVGALNIWIALDEVTPEQGTMRFFDRSHHAGPLGNKMAGDVLQRYPKLPEVYEWLPAFHYQPGDATAHKELLIHGTTANTTTKPRISFVGAYFSDDCVIDAASSRHGMHEPHERFPLVYP